MIFDLRSRLIGARNKGSQVLSDNATFTEAGPLSAVAVVWILQQKVLAVFNDFAFGTRGVLCHVLLPTNSFVPVIREGMLGIVDTLLGRINLPPVVPIHQWELLFMATAFVTELQTGAAGHSVAIVIFMTPVIHPRVSLLR